MTNHDQKDAALSFLKGQKSGTLATLAKDGTPHARTVYFAADDMFGVHFLTLVGTRKVEELAPGAKTAFVVSTEVEPKTLQIEGTVEDLTEEATPLSILHELSNIMFERGLLSAPLTHFDPGKVRFFRIKPTWVRFGDFTKGRGASETLTEIPV